MKHKMTKYPIFFLILFLSLCLTTYLVDAQDKQFIQGTETEGVTFSSTDNDAKPLEIVPLSYIPNTVDESDYTIDPTDSMIEVKNEVRASKSTNNETSSEESDTEDEQETTSDEPTTLNEESEGDKNEKGSINSIIDSDIREHCGYTAEELEEGLKYDLKPLAQDFLDAEEEYDVNAIVLASIAAEESGWGRYCFRSYNIFGFKTSTTFSSYGECIDYVARFLSNKYLSPDGSCYNGTSLSAVNKCYNGNNSWYNNIKSIALSIERDIKN